MPKLSPPKTIGVDVYPGEIEAIRNVIDFATFTGYSGGGLNGSQPPDRKRIKEMRLARELVSRIAVAAR